MSFTDALNLIAALLAIAGASAGFVAYIRRKNHDRWEVVGALAGVLLFSSVALIISNVFPGRPSGLASSATPTSTTRPTATSSQVVAGASPTNTPLPTATTSSRVFPPVPTLTPTPSPTPTPAGRMSVIIEACGQSSNNWGSGPPEIYPWVDVWNTGAGVLGWKLNTDNPYVYPYGSPGLPYYDSTDPGSYTQVVWNVHNDAHGNPPTSPLKVTITSNGGNWEQSLALC